MDVGELRNLKDFLLLFNKLSQNCFKRCVYDMGQLALRQDEINCVDTCVTKNVHANQRLMAIYVEVNPEFQERKMKEQQAEIAAAEAAAAATASSPAVPASDTNTNMQ